jgi:hypothetical protein
MKIIAKLMTLLLGFSLLTAAPANANANEPWFTPQWSANVKKSEIITVNHPIFGNSFLIGLPTDIVTDASGCVDVVYFLGPMNALSKSPDSRGPAGDFLKNYSRFEVSAWSSLGQALGTLTKEGQNGEFAPTSMTIANQKICIPDAVPGSQNSVLLKMKAGVRVTGASDIRELSNVSINLSVPAKIVPPPPAKKTSTITCVKGKITKKVTAVSPKCPQGYKKK